MYLMGLPSYLLIYCFSSISLFRTNVMLYIRDFYFKNSSAHLEFDCSTVNICIYYILVSMLWSINRVDRKERVVYLSVSLGQAVSAQHLNLPNTNTTLEKGYLTNLYTYNGKIEVGRFELSDASRVPAVAAGARHPVPRSLGRSATWPESFKTLVVCLYRTEQKSQLICICSTDFGQYA